MSEEEELVITVRGGVGGILLNRPKKLNCLTIGMIRKMRSRLEAWNQKESGVKVAASIPQPPSSRGAGGGGAGGRPGLL